MTKEKTVRLTSAVCGRVARALAEALYKADVEALEAEGALITERLYEHVFGADVLEKVAAVPPGWVNRYSGMSIIPLDDKNEPSRGIMRVYFGGYIHAAHSKRNVATSATHCAAFLDNPLVYWPTPTHEKNVEVKASDAPVADYLAWFERTENMNPVILDNAIKEATATILSYRTLERLKEGWPEVYPHVKAAYDAIEPAVVSNLPTVSQAHSNTILGLPCPVAGELAA